MTITIADEWWEARGMKQLLELRKRFFGEWGAEVECTCDKCVSVTICALAYDPYNIGGDCLYLK